MIYNIQIPVLDTESGNYDFNGKLSVEDYEEMLVDDYERNRYRMDNAAYRAYKKQSLYAHDNRYNIQEVQSTEDSVDIKYIWSASEAILQTGTKQEIEKEFLTTHFEKQDMFILLININPSKLENDAESEIRFWIDDSKKIHNDKKLDDKHKILLLPERDIKVEVDGSFLTMKNCKILQNYSNEKFPYYFGVIVEKISE